MDRRGFLRGMSGILASGIAPAVIGGGVLMPVRRILMPQPLTINMIPTIPSIRDAALAELSEWARREANRICGVQLDILRSEFTWAKPAALQQLLDIGFFEGHQWP